MKNNRKNNKLLFIRKKNNLRLGKNVYRQVFKISNSEETDIDFGCFVNETISLLHREFNLKLNNVDTQVGANGYDFIKNTRSLLITLSR